MTTVDYRYIYEYMRCILEDKLNLECLEQSRSFLNLLGPLSTFERSMIAFNSASQVSFSHTPSTHYMYLGNTFYKYQPTNQPTISDCYPRTEVNYTRWLI